jgi:hypothetical protein
MLDRHLILGYNFRRLRFAPLAQRIRAFGCGPKGRAFESHKGHQTGPISNYTNK